MGGVTETWPLAGRHRETAAFQATLAGAAASVFVLYGPAGVGKTRLADLCREL
ncbi:MAG: hypothetical protein JWM47_1107, partial [Acidimicrobiales bacterium]|nr:hypothetical protein [Acidimicrobiales bacterium]